MASRPFDDRAELYATHPLVKGCNLLHAARKAVDDDAALVCFLQGSIKSPLQHIQHHRGVHQLALVQHALQAGVLLGLLTQGVAHGQVVEVQLFADALALGALAATRPAYEEKNFTCRYAINEGG